MIAFLVRAGQAALVTLMLVGALKAYSLRDWWRVWAGMGGAYLVHFQVVVVERERAVRESYDETEGT